MTVVVDPARAAAIAGPLSDAFTTTGILGQVAMPEDPRPAGVAVGSLEHILYITLTVTIDYQRDADRFWAASRRTFEDPETRILLTRGHGRRSSRPGDRRHAEVQTLQEGEERRILLAHGGPNVREEMERRSAQLHRRLRLGCADGP